MGDETPPGVLEAWQLAEAEAERYKHLWEREQARAVEAEGESFQRGVRMARAEAARDRLREALGVMVYESEQSWEHERVQDFCRGCGFVWPCATVRARAALASLSTEKESSDG